MDTVISKLVSAVKSDIDAQRSVGFVTDAQEFAATVLCSTVGKKFLASDTTTPEQNATGLQKFLAANERCKKYVFPTEQIAASKTLTRVIGFVREDLRRFWAAIDAKSTPLSILRNGRLSPGAVRFTRETSAYGKLFGSPIVSYGNDTQLRLLTTWHNTLVSRGMSPEQLTPHKPRLRRGNSKLFFVPKNDVEARVACTETMVGMFGQLGFGSLIEDGLRAMYRIDIRRQTEINRAMVFFPGISTIDLSSASDTIARGLCKEILPGAMVNMLNVWRSTHTILPDGGVEELHMLSSMGNGYTFPLETLIFSSVVRAVYRYLGIGPEVKHFAMEDFTFHRAPASYAVFGDDIILREGAYDLTVEVLTLFGFTVNPQKSFKSGDFKESCGVDVFKGVDVRGVYVKSLSSPPDVCVAYNGLLGWSQKWDIPLPKSLGYLRRIGPSYEAHRVPPWESENAGYRAADLIQNRPVVTYRAFQPVPARLILSPDGTTFVSDAGKVLVVYPEGVLQAALAARIDEDGFSERPVIGAYETVYRRTHNWAVKQQGAVWIGMRRAGLTKPAKVSLDSEESVSKLFSSPVMGTEVVEPAAPSP